MTDAAAFSTEAQSVSRGGERSRPFPAGNLKSHYDAVVFGSGPAATIFAIQMTRRRRTVLIVRATRRPVAKPFGETLAPRGEFLLRRLGIDKLSVEYHCAADSVLSSWRHPSLERIDMGFDPHGRMWHVNRLAFDEDLMTLATATGSDLLCSSSHTDIRFERISEGWELHLGSARSVTTSFLVDATGRSAAIARRLGSRRVVKDRLVAISSVCEQRKPAQSLLIEAVSGGWWYSIPLAGGKLLLAFITDPSSERLSKGRRRSFWDAMLKEAHHTAERAGTLTQEPDVAYVESAFSERMSGDGWIAIGDAAMTFDPLSSHGLTSAIEQGIELAEILLGGTDPSAISAFDSNRLSLFEKYQSQRVQFYSSVHRFSGQTFWQNRVVH